MFTAGELNGGRRGLDELPAADRMFGFVVLANWDYTPVDGFAQGIIEIYLPRPATPPPPPAKKSQPAAKKAVMD
jgi:hypothetical protein